MTGQGLAPGVRNVTEVPFELQTVTESESCTATRNHTDFNDNSANVDKPIGLQSICFLSTKQLLLVNMWLDSEARMENGGLQWELSSIVADA